MSFPSGPLAPSAGRYYLPQTPYFADFRDAIPLAQLAGYARAERRAALVADNYVHCPLIDVSWAHEYSPYGAGLVERMREDPRRADDLTGRGNRAAVVSPATAILGLGSAADGDQGSLRAVHSWPIMVGKAKIFGLTAGVDTTPLTPEIRLTREQLEETGQFPLSERAAIEKVRIWRAKKFAEFVQMIAPMYGFINIEDAQGADLPIIFGALKSLEGECAIWSDDMQGTGVITAAAVLAWAELTNRRDLSEVRAVIFGAGAGAAGVYNELINHGFSPGNILVTDSGPKTAENRPRWKGEPYPLHEGREDVNNDRFKVQMRQGISSATTIESFFKGGVDLLINLGIRGTLTGNRSWTEDRTRELNPNFLFLPMTNPDPGITPEMLWAVRPDGYYGSGNQTYPNTVNNFTAFGYVGLGALIAMAGGVGRGMTVAAARGIFEVAKKHPDFGSKRLVPKPDDLDLIAAEAGAVAKAAAREGLARGIARYATELQLAEFDRRVDERIRFQRAYVENYRERTRMEGLKYLEGRYQSHYAPFAPRDSDKIPAYHVAPQIDKAAFERFAMDIGDKVQWWEDLIDKEDTEKLIPTALTIVLEKLKAATIGETDEARRALKELEIIVQIAAVHPALGLALALRRTRVRPENLPARPTVFHRDQVRRIIFQEIPEATATVLSAFPDIQMTSAPANGNEPNGG